MTVRLHYQDGASEDHPLKNGEQTYDWYRKTHADWAAKRYGVDPKAVGDGMDT